ncbi:MAG: hypothetical protein QW815_05100 [Nitrososphaerota archaeon]
MANRRVRGELPEGGEDWQRLRAEAFQRVGQLLNRTEEAPSLARDLLPSHLRGARLPPGMPRQALLVARPAKDWPPSWQEAWRRVRRFDQRFPPQHHPVAERAYRAVNESLRGLFSADSIRNMYLGEAARLEEQAQRHLADIASGKGGSTLEAMRLLREAQRLRGEAARLNSEVGQRIKEEAARLEGQPKPPSSPGHGGLWGRPILPSP